nr:MAG TPA: hypothetical protein [Bacteriophage sp.]
MFLNRRYILNTLCTFIIRCILIYCSFWIICYIISIIF